MTQRTFTHKIRIAFAGFALVGVLGITSCNSAGPSTAKGPQQIKDDRLAFDAYPQIVPLDQSQKLIVLRGEPVEGVADSGIYSVRVPLRSIARRAEVFRYRFVYFDRDGAEIDRDQWVSISVPAGSAVQARGRSMRSGIADWRLDIGREFGIRRKP